MHGIIDPFYLESDADHEPGQIWCDHPVYLPARHGLKFTRADPTDDSKLDYEICGRTAEIYNHPPVHSLTMKSTEGAVIAKTKKDRPVIVLGGHGASQVSPARAASHADIVMVVPVYGADQYTEAMRRRMRVYDFSNLFYLPAVPAFHFDEGFTRLDHVQPVQAAHLSKHRGLRLAPEALDALNEWLLRFLTNTRPADSLIEEYRQMVIDAG
jgi:hypothetical protein